MGQREFLSAVVMVNEHAEVQFCVHAMYTEFNQRLMPDFIFIFLRVH